MTRTLIKETPEKVGEEVLLQGWVSVRRNMGKLIFIDLRDRSGLVQVVFTPEKSAKGGSASGGKELLAQADALRPEFVVSITGKVNKRPEKMVNPKLATGLVEIEAQRLEILAKAESLPFDLEDETGVEVYLDNLPITLRTPKRQAIFKIQSEIVRAFRDYLQSHDFIEFQSPKIVAQAMEGGADVFEIKYFDKKAYLGQSPQFYKQIMVGVFERVFTVGNVYRAEEHSTTRHLNEYTSLDFEMGFINDHQDVMAMLNKTISHIVSCLKKDMSREFDLFEASLPDVPDKIPVLKLREVQKIIKKEFKEDCVKEPDLSPQHERWICEYALKKYNSEFVFVTHYPVEKRPMYTYPDSDDPGYTKSFDLLFRGEEIVTGGQRINNYEALAANIKKWGFKPEDYSFYLEAFKYGMPPEGGVGMGLERLTARLLNLANIREATLFPRDLNRIDLLLSK